VIVQTLDTEARSLRYAADHDSEGFLTGELARRELLRYPPFGHLIRVVCSAARAGPEAAAADAVAERLDLPEATVLGPAPLFRRQGRERAQLLIKAPVGARAAAVRALRRAVESAASDRKLRDAAISVDVDPQ
jgi:primosomal protein N' (replication factor Y)